MPIEHNVITWERLCSACNRTSEESEKARVIAATHITSLYGIVIFTDGSAVSNPGPGAGADIYLEGTDMQTCHLVKSHL